MCKSNIPEDDKYSKINKSQYLNFISTVAEQKRRKKRPNSMNYNHKPSLNTDLSDLEDEDHLMVKLYIQCKHELFPAKNPKDYRGVSRERITSVGSIDQQDVVSRKTAAQQQ